MKTLKSLSLACLSCAQISETQEKARLEMEADSLTELDVAESILNAVAIYKTIRSRSPLRQRVRGYLYVIQSTNLDGLMI